MARVKVLLFALVALGLLYWSVSSSGGASAAAAKQADAALAQAQAGLTAALAVQGAHQRAVADELMADPGVVAALVKAAGSDIGPSVEDAPALQAALAKATQQLPEADRAFAAAALATQAGAVAVVPGHDHPLTASAFAWLDAAAKAGGDGTDAEVAGHAVRVFATPVRAVRGGEVVELGKIAIAFERDAKGYAKLLEAFPGTTLVHKGKVLATSDKAHAEAAAKLTAGSSKPLQSGPVASFLIFKLPMPAPTLVQARAFAVPGGELTAVVTADLTPIAAAVATGQKAGLVAMIVVLVLGLGLAATSGGEKPTDLDDAAVLQAEEPTAAPAHAQPPPPPEPTDVITRQQMSAAPPPAPREEATRVVQVAIPPAATPDAVPGFDDLFNSPAAPTAPAVSKPAPPAAASSGDFERTGLMSRDVLNQLAAQAAQPAAIPLPSTAARSGGPVAIPLPGSRPTGTFTPIEERTAVAAVPADLLRAAAQPASVSAEDQHFQEVFREFVQTRERCGEPPENLTFDKFAAKLRKNKDQLVQKYACKSVRFQVYVKEGKAALKATPVKEA